MDIDMIWRNVQLHEGEIFKTKRGIDYTYVMYDDYLFINNDKKRRITKFSLASALAIETPTPSKINSHGIWAPSYIYGIITDERIHTF